MRGAPVCFIHFFVANFSLHPHSTDYPNWISTLTIRILQINPPHWWNQISQDPILASTSTSLTTLYQTYPPFPIFNIVLQVPVFLHSSEILRHLSINWVPSRNHFLLVFHSSTITCEVCLGLISPKHSRVRGPPEIPNVGIGHGRKVNEWCSNRPDDELKDTERMK